MIGVCIIGGIAIIAALLGAVAHHLDVDDEQRWRTLDRTDRRRP